jgi:hypothetical protein
VEALARPIVLVAPRRAGAPVVWLEVLGGLVERNQILVFIACSRAARRWSCSRSRNTKMSSVGTTNALSAGAGGAEAEAEAEDEPVAGAEREEEEEEDAATAEVGAEASTSPAPAE